MSVTAKQTFIKEVLTQLEDSVTSKQGNEIAKILNLTLSNYEIERIYNDETDSDTQDFIDAFFSAKTLEGRSAKTMALYNHILSRFFKQTHTPIRQITVFHLRAFLQGEKARGLADKTLEGQRSIFCSFFGWCHKEGLLPSNPTANLAPIKCPKIVRLPFSDVDIERLLEACTQSRDKAIIMFLLATGCRISEAVSLNRDDIDFANGKCIVLGKGAKERQVYLTDVSLMYVARYLAERKDTSPALFTTRLNSRITTNAVRKTLHTIADVAGVENVHPHRFRRTLATNLIAHGMPVQEVAAVLGHEKLDTTMEYVYMADSDIQNNYRKYA